MTDPRPAEPEFAADARVVHGGGDPEERAAAIAALVAAIRAMPARTPPANGSAANESDANGSLSLWKASARGVRQPFSAGPARWRSFDGRNI